MIQIEDKLIADDILTREFACDLTRCHGACCIEGDAGAPLEKEETAVLESALPGVIPFLRPKGLKAIEQQGAWIMGQDGTPETPLIDGAECAYVVFDERKTALCAIEQAWRAKKIKFKKPVSCHLYPIRVSCNKMGELLNYDDWTICRSACVNGKNKAIKVYMFLKDPIERKWGKLFFRHLKNAALLLEKKSIRKK